MQRTLTFSRVARLCYAAHAGTTTISLPQVQAVLELPQNIATAVLDEAVTAGYLRRRGAKWALTERGTRLGLEMKEATDTVQKAATSYFVRPFTEFRPTGEEDLSVGGA